MNAVSVGKLKLQCEAHQRDRLRSAIEDGLRTTLPEENRLVLLRRMRIAGSLASPAQREAAVRTGWLAAVAGARHGSADSAGDANCVWFESREEAEALLLARLLAGRAADAWFWRLAVPRWRGLPLRAWLPACLAEALAEGDDRRVLALAGACIAAGASDRLVEALADSPLRRPETGFAGAAAPVAPRAEPAAPSPADAGSGPEAVASLGLLPSRLHDAVASLVRAAGDAPIAARAILRAWALRRSPALALAPVRLAATLAAILDEIRSPGSPVQRREIAAKPPPPGPRREKQPEPPDAPIARPGDTRIAEATAGPRPPDPGAPPVEATEPASPFPGSPAAEPPLFRRHRHSDHAGLWLVLPSLVQLGFREWLATQPALLGDHPASQLLHAIARHHRIAAVDPALRALPPADDGPFPPWTALWRHGLDRWLRRTVRRRLHDLVNRPGEMDWDDWRVEILYPASAVDIALRRRALDRDPGWTDWLGLSVRYHFGGEVGCP